MKKNSLRKNPFLINIFQLVFSLSLLAACSNFPSSVAPLPTPILETEQAATPTVPEIELTTTVTDSPQILRVWLPPQFDPNAETDAGALLRTRLDNFQKRRPDLILEVRIKSIDGQASLLNALIATQKAAPSAMPDLVALTRPDLENAAKQGILHPIDGLTTLLDDPDWFPYTRPMAHIQNTAYGLPFATNLLGLRYLPTEEAPLPIIENLQEQEIKIAFPTDNTQSYLSFCLYSASGNPLQDEDGQPTLDEETLTALLSFYQNNFVTLVSVDEEVIESENTIPILWTNDFLTEASENKDTIITPIPGPEGIVCSLASVWLWSLAGTAPDLQPAAIELAEYLSDSIFLAEWATAIGTLPPRPTALDENQIALHELSLAAQPFPSNDTVEMLGEIFRTAEISVLQERVEPSAAAREALENIQ